MRGVFELTFLTLFGTNLGCRAFQVARWAEYDCILRPGPRAFPSFGRTI